MAAITSNQLQLKLWASSTPIAVESLCPFESSTSSFLSNLGNKIHTSSGEDEETSFLFSASLFLFNFQFCASAMDGPDQ